MTPFAKRLALVVAVCMLAFGATVANAGQITLGSASHPVTFGDPGYYVWGVRGLGIPAGQQLVSVTFTIHVSDSQPEYPANSIGFDLLPNTAAFSSIYHQAAGFPLTGSTDPGTGYEFWNIQHIHQSPTVDTFSTQLLASNPANAVWLQILSGSWFGIGLDPECHYTAWMTVDYTTAPVPEPASMTLLGIGLAGAATVLRRRRRS